jgi:heterotetrameric sarcosine oxidase gamma subunit
MDNSGRKTFVVAIDGLSVIEERGLLAASLRYFDPADRFVAAVHESVGRPLPARLGAVQVDLATRGAHIILAWRSPTETLLLTADAVAFAELELRLAAEVDGCMVDQTGGVSAFRVSGLKARDMLLRLGAVTSIPDLGEARSGRLAELQVMTVCVQAGEFLMLVERVYAHHLLEWIGAAAGDFQ